MVHQLSVQERMDLRLDSLSASGNLVVAYYFFSLFCAFLKLIFWMSLIFTYPCFFLVASLFSEHIPYLGRLLFRVYAGESLIF